MSVSNETLLVHITSLKELVTDLKDRDIKDIRDCLDTMNGRQRTLTERVSGNEGNIDALQWRIGQVESDFKVSINLRTLLMVALSTISSFIAYISPKQP